MSQTRFVAPASLLIQSETFFRGKVLLPDYKNNLFRWSVTSMTNVKHNFGDHSECSCTTLADAIFEVGPAAEPIVGEGDPLQRSGNFAVQASRTRIIIHSSFINSDFLKRISARNPRFTFGTSLENYQLSDTNLDKGPIDGKTFQLIVEPVA